MILRILINLLFIYALWQLIKFVFRIALAYWIRKNAGKAFHHQGNFGRGFQGEPQRPVGDIRVENPAQQRKDRTDKSSEGEYVDFEEIS